MIREHIPQIPPEATHAAAIVREILGEAVVAVYLFGSAVAGGLRIDSDVDVLVAVKRGLDYGHRRDLTHRLMEISGRAGNRRASGIDSARPLELTVVNIADVVPWRYPPRGELVYGEWLREHFESRKLAMASCDPDLVIVLRKVMEHGVSLYGPEAASLFEPIPMRDVRRAIGDAMPALLEGLQGDERNVILTLARMWLTAATGAFAPKDVAAQWAAGRLPDEQAALLRQARSAYLETQLGEIGHHWHDRQTALSALVYRMRQAIRDELDL